MDRLHSLRLLRTVAEGDATGLGRIEIFFDPRDESVLDEDAHHGVHFDPTAIRPDTAHRVLGPDAARCRNVAALPHRHRTGDRAPLFPPAHHHLDRPAPWGKLMPARRSPGRT